MAPTSFAMRIAASRGSGSFGAQSHLALTAASGRRRRRGYFALRQPELVLLLALRARDDLELRELLRVEPRREEALGEPRHRLGADPGQRGEHLVVAVSLERGDEVGARL